MIAPPAVTADPVARCHPRLIFALVAVAHAVACRGASPASRGHTDAAGGERPVGAPSDEARASSSAAAVGAPGASATPPALGPGAVDDAAFGAMVRAISERGGEFPSDNLVSNETSYLHVADALAAPHLRGGVYVGVGPEQNFAYLALVRPSMAFLVDVRRDNLVVHLMYKVAFERGATRGAFLCWLFSRELPSEGTATSTDATGADVSGVLRWVEGRAKVAPTRWVEATLQRAHELGVAFDAHDRAHVEAVAAAFAAKGAGLRYTMKGSSRPYPALGDLLAATDDAGVQRGFLASDEAYASVRALQVANRVVPIVADLGGDGAMPRLAHELARRGERVTTVYASNVEQYLFGPGVWGRWVRNLGALPRAPGAVLVRVCFDQGRPHPRQRPGHRTTSLVAPIDGFLRRAARPGYATWWQVVTDEGAGP